MKKTALITLALVTAGIANAEVNISFDYANDISEVPGLNRNVGENELLKVSDGKVLKVNSPKGLVRIKTNTTSKRFSVSIDWLCSKGSAGDIIALTDYNHNKRLFSINSNFCNIKGSSFSGKKDRYKKLFKATPNNWYRFNIEAKGKSYTVEVIDRGTDNWEDGEIVYDSVEKKRKLRTNAKVTPHVFFMSQWRDESGASFSYDNLVLKD